MGLGIKEYCERCGEVYIVLLRQVVYSGAVLLPSSGQYQLFGLI